jgi:hypothetical protein
MDASVPRDLAGPIDTPSPLKRDANTRAEGEVAVVGGPNLTPGNDPPFAQLSGEILASPLATGRTSDRWRRGVVDVNATESKLHGCFLCFRGDLLRRHLFVETLFPNDENELMSRLRHDGFRLAYVPHCSVQHRRRATLRSHVKQVYVSGRGRGELVRRSGIRGQWPYLVPLVFTMYLLAVAALTTRFPAIAAPLVLYGALAFVLSFSIWRRRRRGIFLWAGALMFVSHAAYAVGLLRGLVAAKRHDAGQVAVELLHINADVGHADVAASPRLTVG